MMTKKIYMILLAMALATACAKDYTENYHDPFWDSGQGGENDPIVFLNETDPAAWLKLEFEDRFNACEVPGTILQAKSTYALGLSILHYPMNGILYAYNYLDMPVKMVYDRSPLHQTLAHREDAAATLVDIFDMTSINPMIFSSKDYMTLCLNDELFLELFLGTGLVPGLDSRVNKERLKATVSRKMDERRKDASFSDISLIPLAYMNERLGLGLKFDDNIVEMMHLFTLRDGLFNK